MPELIVEDLELSFGGVRALDRLSFAVEEGQLCALVGPNGAGKSSVFNCVTGLYRASGGRVMFGGRDLLRLPAHAVAAAGVARTFQNLALFPRLTVLENVMTGATHTARTGLVPALLGLPRSDRDERRLREHARAVLAELGIEKYADAAPDTLPFAVRQRVALARALAARPRLLLLDEPAGGLGADDVDALAELIRRLPHRAADPCAVLLVEHHMDLVMAVCDRIVVLDFGRVVAAGPPEAVREDPAVVDAYLGAAVDEAA